MAELPRSTPCRSEAAAVERWRLEQALDLTRDLDLAERFAASSGDLRALERLIKTGCDPRLAVEIVV